MLFLFVTSCEDEDIIIGDEQNFQDEYNFEVENITFESLINDSLINEKISKISSVFDVNRNDKESHKDVFSKDSSFVVLTEKILKVSTDSTTTYSFLIKDVTDPTSNFENFVIEKINDTYRFIIYKFKRLDTNEDFPFSISKLPVSEDQINIGFFADLLPEAIPYIEYCLEIIPLNGGGVVYYSIDCENMIPGGRYKITRIYNSNTGSDPNSDTGDPNNDTTPNDTGNNDDNSGYSSNDEVSGTGDGGGGNGGSDTSSDNDNIGAPTGINSPCGSDVILDDCIECEPGSYKNEDGICVIEHLIVDQSFLDVECLNNVYNKMNESSTDFNDILKSFDEEFSVADLILTVDENFRGNEDSDYHGAFAITKPPLSNNQVRIIFNTDSSLDSDMTKQPDVFKAVSLIHEAIHANMYRKMLDVIKHAELNQTNINWTNYSSTEFYNVYLSELENQYFGIFEYFTRYKYGIPTDDNPNDWQHQQMAQHYRGIIIQALSDYDPTLTIQQKEALSWLGLKETNIVAWQNYPNKSSVTSTITNIKSTFTNGCD